MTAIKPCPQCPTRPGDDSQRLAHARACPVCQAQVFRCKSACNDPALGFLASMSLGEPEPLAELASHLEGCLACRLERLDFASLDEQAVTPGSAWLSRLRSAEGIRS